MSLIAEFRRLEALSHQQGMGCKAEQKWFSEGRADAWAAAQGVAAPFARRLAALETVATLAAEHVGDDCACNPLRSEGTPQCLDCRLRGALAAVGGKESPAAPVKCAGCIANECGSDGLRHTCGKAEEAGTSPPSVAWAYRGQLRNILERVAKRFEGTELALDRAGELIDEAYQRGLQVGFAAGVDHVQRVVAGVSGKEGVT